MVQRGFVYSMTASYANSVEFGFDVSGPFLFVGVFASSSPQRTVSYSKCKINMLRMLALPTCSFNFFTKGVLSIPQPSAWRQSRISILSHVVSLESNYEGFVLYVGGNVSLESVIDGSTTVVSECVRDCFPAVRIFGNPIFRVVSLTRSRPRRFTRSADLTSAYL